MASYTYIKKEPKYKVFKTRKGFSGILTHLILKQKIGIGLILLGIVIMGIPLAESAGLFADTSSKVINPVPISELSASVAESNASIDKRNPLSSYISSHSVATARTAPFYLSFPSLKLKNILVTPNVDSTDSNTYEKVLTHSTAQLAGSSLPGQGGNTFIYGHSSIPWFHQIYPMSYEGVFTALFDLNIGDTIIITMDNNTYTYVIEGITTIKADDYSQIQSISGINTLTLMTCSPPGIGEERLIVKAVQI